MQGGLQLEDVEAGFVASDEFSARFGGTRAGWVTGLYRTVLGREPAAEEVRWWATRLSAGATRTDVARGFLYSTEHLTTVVDGYYAQLLRRPSTRAGLRRGCR